MDDFISSIMGLLTTSEPGTYSLVVVESGDLLFERYTRSGRTEDLDSSISSYRKELGSTSPSDPIYPHLLTNLSGAIVSLLKMPDKPRRSANLEDGMKHLRAGVNLFPPDDPLRPTFLQRIAHALFFSHRHFGKIKDLEDSITFYRQAFALRAPEDPDFFPSVLTFACALTARYENTGKEEDMDESIPLYRKLIDVYPPGDLNHRVVFQNLANTLLARYQRSGRIEDLEASVSLNQKALSLCPTDHSDRVNILDRLHRTIIIRYQLFLKIQDLEDSIAVLRELLGLHPCDHPVHFAYLMNLATLLHTFSEETGKVGYLKESIALFRNALTLRAAGDPEYSPVLVELAAALLDLFKRSGDDRNLDEGIEFIRKSVSLYPAIPGHRVRLANALFFRYGYSSRIEDLDDSISCYRKILNLQIYPIDNPTYFSWFLGLALALSKRAQRFGKLEDVEEALLLYRHTFSVSNPPGNNNDHQLRFENFARTLLMHYKHLGRIEDLEDSILFYRKCYDLLPPHHPNYTRILQQLGTALEIWYRHSKKIEDLEAIILLYREGISLLSPNHSGHFNLLMSLANWILVHFDKSGKIEHLKEAITLYHKAVDSSPPDNITYASCLEKLGVSLLLSAEYSVENKEIIMEEAISFNRKALSLSSLDHPQEYVSALLCLANGLSFCYKHSPSRVEILEESISLYHQVLTLADTYPTISLTRGIILVAIGTSLVDLFEQSGRAERIEEAILLFNTGLSLQPPDDSKRHVTLTGLARALFCRYLYSNQSDDADKSILLQREALSILPLNHPTYVHLQINLAMVLQARYKCFRREEDIEESISILQNALIIHPPGSPNRSKDLTLLAGSLIYRSQYTGENQDKIFALYEQAAHDQTTFPYLRLYAATGWAHNARLCHHKSALTAYRISLHLLGCCLVLYPNIEAQQRFLATSGKHPRTLASEAAAAALNTGNIETAVEFLEQGRAFLWSKVGSYKYTLGELRQIEGGVDLADCFELLSADLEQSVLFPASEHRLFNDGAPRTDPAKVLSMGEQIKHHRTLSEEWDCLVDKIRKIKGFENFMQPPSFKMLQSVAAQGPVIVVNISEFRSDAIILLKDNNPAVVTLPGVFWKEIIDQVIQRTNGQGLTALLRYLWNNIVSPVVDCLTRFKVPEKSRIWWCPTSVLCTLPLHAAGPYRHGERNLPDIYISSYTSTLSALIKARSTTPRASTLPKLLVVGQPSETLQRVNEEIEVIQQFGESVDVLLGNEADHKTVLESLKEHSWVHLACHGHQSYSPGILGTSRPFQASFELHNNQHLTLLDLIQARLPNAELAFLSACDSAAGDVSTPDENIHLAAALQFCGFQSVVGTLWEMDDKDGPTISRAFYKHMFRNGPDKTNSQDSAEALNLAIQELRKNNVPKERWVPFVHIGA